MSATESIMTGTAAVAVREDVSKKAIQSGSEFDLYRLLHIEPGSNFKIEAFDEHWRMQRSYEDLLPVIRSYSQRIDNLQFVMHAEKKHSLLIILESLDSGGKDGVVRHILASINPAGCRVTAFRQPTPIELAHDFLWRVHPHVPARGEVAIFNRSHYEDVLVARVHRLVSAKVCQERFAFINEFEKLLTIGNFTTIVKFFLHISKEEQLARFKRRLEDPLRRCQVAEEEYKERDLWDEHMKAFEDMLGKTSTRHAPWFIIPANDKWFRDMAVSQILLRTFEDLDMHLPESAADLTHIRREYHHRDMESKSKAS